uniref:Uncharacterized protein n=1 Tax=Cacopsylla melanoneura TaxID=428564 RepID=A0A8D9E9G8_9HEMI
MISSLLCLKLGITELTAPPDQLSIIIPLFDQFVDVWPNLGNMMHWFIDQLIIRFIHELFSEYSYRYGAAMYFLVNSPRVDNGHPQEHLKSQFSIPLYTFPVDVPI